MRIKALRIIIKVPNKVRSKSKKVGDMNLFSKQQLARILISRKIYEYFRTNNLNYILTT